MTITPPTGDTPLTDEALETIRTTIESGTGAYYGVYAKILIAEVDRLRSMKCATCGKRIGYINYKGYLLGWGCADAEQCEQGLPHRFDTERGEVLVEDSWFKVEDLPEILGNFMRASAEHGREAKRHAMEVQRLRAENTALAAKVSTAREAWEAAETAWMAGVAWPGDMAVILEHCKAMRAALGETGGTDA
jgi:hypothetical protein